jgi:5-methylcytosine-specific restriction protein A
VRLRLKSALTGRTLSFLEAALTRQARARLAFQPPRISTIDARTSQPAAKVAAPFYASTEWRVLVAQLIKARGRICKGCGRTGTRLFGDHIIELQDGGESLSAANVQMLCGSCHSRKSAVARAARQAKRHLPGQI